MKIYAREDITAVVNLCRWCDFGPATGFVLLVFSSRLAVHFARDSLPAACARYIFSCRS